MKSKVEAIKCAAVVALISFGIYIECQLNFHCVNYVLNMIADILKVLVTNDNLYSILSCGYIWLKKLNGETGKEIVGTVASGVFGSIVVTGIIYIVEYKIQLREYINNLIISQKEHIRTVNALTHVSSFIDDPYDMKRNAYMEYIGNSSKLYRKEKFIKRIESKKSLSDNKKREIIERNQSLFSFKHHSDNLYKEWIWNTASEEKRNRILKGCEEKEIYLNDVLKDLFFKTDLELIAAFYDYRELYLKDISKIKQITDEIYFLNKKNENNKMIKEAITLDEKMHERINLELEGFFESTDMYASFRESRKSLLEKIESLQNYFYEENMKQVRAVNIFNEWCERIKKDILKEKFEEEYFPEPKNKFRIGSDGASYPYEFLRRTRLQCWDYKQFTDFDKNREYLEKMGYKY